MTTGNQVAVTRERKLYRQAVQASLQAFYGKSEVDSKKLVRDWWKRLSTTRAYETGLFMHSELMNTAAGIAGAPVVPITSHNRDTYHRLLGQSPEFTLQGHVHPVAPNEQALVKL